MISYTRALGMARTGDITGAETETAKLQSLKQKLDQAKDDYWAKQVEVQRLAASGILAHAKGDDNQAVELVRAAADLDATMDKHPATPAEVLPARELLADLLLELNDPAAALKEYEQNQEPEALHTALSSARSKDAISIWHLLARTQGQERLIAFTRFSELVKLPVDLTKQRVLQSDPSAVDEMWNALDLGDTKWWRTWKRPW